MVIPMFVAFVILVMGRSCEATQIVYTPVYECTATAYTAAPDECGRDYSDPNFGITASGEFVREGFIAVDPDIIPLHSLVYVEGAGKFDGFYEAKDTGGAVKGNRIDIYVPDKLTAFEFGKRKVTVYVLRIGEFMERGFFTFDGYGELHLPERKTELSAGYDFEVARDTVIKPHTVEWAHTGIGVTMYSSDVLFIAPRSSLCKMGLMLANNIAVIDADYKGEIWLPLFNFSDKEVVVTKGTRVAQGIFLEYNTLGDIVTQQRIGGIGSTD